MNGQYLQRMTAEQIYPHLVPFLGDAPPPLDALRVIIDMHKVRARTLAEMAEQAAVYFAPDDAVAYDDEAVKKHLKGDELPSRMRDLRDALARTEPFDVTSAEQSLRALAESSGLGAGKLIHPLRVALTGKMASPPIFDVAVVLGKARTLARLDRLIATLPTA